MYIRTRAGSRRDPVIGRATLGHDVTDVAVAVSLGHDDPELAAAHGRLTVEHDAGLLHDVYGAANHRGEMPLSQDRPLDRAFDPLGVEDYRFAPAVPEPRDHGDQGHRPGTGQGRQGERDDPSHG